MARIEGIYLWSYERISKFIKISQKIQEEMEWQSLMIKSGFIKKNLMSFIDTL
jgi:hypothetical protein